MSHVSRLTSQINKSTIKKMKGIVIYKHKEGNSINKVIIVPSRFSEEEMNLKIAEYNKDSENRLYACLKVLQDELFTIVEFLINDRTKDLNRHIEALKDVKEDISQIDDYLYAIVRDIRSELEKQHSEN